MPPTCATWSLEKCTFLDYTLHIPQSYPPGAFVSLDKDGVNDESHISSSDKTREQDFSLDQLEWNMSSPRSFAAWGKGQDGIAPFTAHAEAAWVPFWIFYTDNNKTSSDGANLF